MRPGKVCPVDRIQPYQRRGAEPRRARHDITERGNAAGRARGPLGVGSSACWAALYVDLRKLARPSEYGRDLDEGGLAPIHDSVFPGDGLSQIGSLSLRHHSARIGKLSKPLNGCNKAAHGEVGPSRRVDLDECANLFEISY